ncbi:unnamed protein product [Coregonus sp. 'balchen']|nr:unnamed protein product [Coregonus sp. 'balchen']
MVKVTTEHFQGFFQERAVDVEQGNNKCPGKCRRTLEKQWRLPGMDGLPAEFYLKFWGILGPVVLKVLKAILETGDRWP